MSDIGCFAAWHEPPELRDFMKRWQAQLQEAGDTATLRALRRKFPVILHWAIAHGGDEAQFLLKQESPMGVMARASQWNRSLKRGLRETIPPWHRRLAVTAHERWRVLELTNPVDLFLESQAMRHDAEAWLKHCRQGNYVVLSVRNLANGKRVATVGIMRDPSAQTLALHQVAGYCCGEVSREIHDLAQACCTQFNNSPERAMRMLAGMQLPMVPD